MWARGRSAETSFKKMSYCKGVNPLSGPCWVQPHKKHKLEMVLPKDHFLPNLVEINPTLIEKTTFYCISMIKGSSPLTGPYYIWPHKKHKLVMVLPKYHAELIWKKLAH